MNIWWMLKKIKVKFNFPSKSELIYILFLFFREKQMYSLNWCKMHEKLNFPYKSMQNMQNIKTLHNVLLSLKLDNIT